MDVEYLICMNSLGIISLSLLIFFVVNNVVFDKKWMKVFFLATILNFFLIILDGVEYIIEYQYPFDYVFKNILICICYITNPAMPLVLISLSYYDERFRLQKFIIFMINALVAILSTIFVITLNGDSLAFVFHQISKFTQAIVSVGLFVLMIAGVINEIKTIRKKDYIFILIIVFVIIGAFLVESITSVRFLLWNATAICLLIFYLFLHIDRLKTDVMTGLPNRYVFENDMKKFDKDENIIVVFDINNLKVTNDSKGHIMGDELIVEAANAISETFKSKKTYRIGGDEFVCLLKEMDEEQLNNLLIEFTKKLAKANVAYGYSYTKDCMLKEAFQIADDMMYKHKRELKH